MNIVNKTLKDIAYKYPKYETNVKNYFVKSQITFFEDKSLDYCNIQKKSSTLLKIIINILKLN